MKLSIPEPQIIITHINDIPIDEFESNIRGLDLVNVKGNILDSNGQIIDNYQGELTSTVYDKEIQRSTLGNDGTTDNSGNPILLDFKTLGKFYSEENQALATVNLNLIFVVPRDVG